MSSTIIVWAIVGVIALVFSWALYYRITRNAVRDGYIEAHKLLAVQRTPKPTREEMLADDEAYFSKTKK